MADQRGKARCPETGLTVPECSCRRCLEAMLRAVQPGLFEGDIRVVRLSGPGRDRPGEGERRAA